MQSANAQIIEKIELLKREIHYIMATEILPGKCDLLEKRVIKVKNESQPGGASNA